MNPLLSTFSMANVHAASLPSIRNSHVRDFYRLQDVASGSYVNGGTHLSIHGVAVLQLELLALGEGI